MNLIRLLIISILNLSINSYASIIIFESNEPLRAVDFNNNFNIIKNQLEEKFTNIDFNIYRSGDVIDKNILESDFEQVRNLGILVPYIDNNKILAEEINIIFASIVSGVNNFDDPPKAYNSFISTNEDTTLFNTVQFTNAVGNTTISVIQNVQYGLLTLNSSNGSFIYVPNQNYNGQDSFTFQVNDGQQNSLIRTVSISINPVNDAPTTTSLLFAITEDTSFSSMASAEDIDQNNTLIYSVINQGTKGSFVFTNPNTGAFSYIPNLNSTGSDTVSFKVNDGSLDSNISTITFNISGINDAPVLSDLNILTNEDTTFAGNIMAVDPDNTAFTYSIVSSPSNGIALINPITGAFNYTPNLNYNGNDSFTIKANDGSLDSNIATVSIVVNPINDAPVVISQTQNVTEYTTYTGILSATDIENNLTTFTVSSQGAKGTLTILNSSTGEFTYVPNPGTSGTDNINIIANDGFINSSPVAITMNIKAVDSSCDNIKARGLSSGYYDIDFDTFGSGEAPQSLYCEFSVDGSNAWTQVARINKDATTWNAWSTDFNLNKTDTNQTFGVRMQRFTQNLTGRDLEVMIRVDGQFRNIIYYDVDLNEAFNPLFSSGSNVQIQDGFFFRSFGETSYTRCGVTIEVSNRQWNWSIADSGDSTCGGLSSRGGFLLGSNSGTTTEIANIIYGLNTYNNVSSFSNVEVFVRKKTLTYPISCQHAFDNGLISASGQYNIDVDSDGTFDLIQCSVSGSTALTLLINFGNNTDFNNRAVLRNGLTNNSEANVEAAGFTTNANNWNNRDYTTNNSYLQFFLGGPSTGYISIRGPKWGGTVQSTYRALNGDGNNVRFRINNVFGNTNYSIIDSGSATPVVAYSFRDVATFFWEEYPSSVAGIDVIWIK